MCALWIGGVFQDTTETELDQEPLASEFDELGETDPYEAARHAV